MEGREPLRVLLADDDAHFVAAMLRHLHGLAVTIAPSIAELRAQVGEGPYDAMILDVKFPDGSGLDVFDELRGAGNTTPTLVVTGEPNDAAIARTQFHGAEFLAKGDTVTGANLRAFLARCESARASRADRVLRRAKLAGCTSRESDVVLAYARDVCRSRASVARELGVAESTVKSHVHAILALTGAESMPALVRAWLAEP